MSWFSRFTIGFMLISVIVLSIVVPLVSLKSYGGDVDGIVYVVFSGALRDYFESNGYRPVDVFIAMLAPAPGVGGSYVFSFNDVVGERVRLDFRGAARAWSEFYSSDVGKRVLRSSPSLPTVSITITLYKGDLECVAQYTYSTIDFFVEKGFNVVEATRMAGEDPLAHLRKPLVIVLKPRMPKGDLRVSCVDLSPALEKLKRALDEKLNLTHYIERTITPSTVTPTSSCSPNLPAGYSEVWWIALYESRDDPPEGWLRNIEGPVSDDVKRDKWRRFAEAFSKAYYRRADLYPYPDWALTSVYREIEFILGSSMFARVQGIHRMDDWVKYLFQNSNVYWMDYDENYGDQGIYKSGYVPYLGVYIKNPQNKPLEVESSMAIVYNSYYRHGITVAGVLFVGSETMSTVGNTISASVNGVDTRQYITMWTLYIYLWDSMLIKYDLKKVTISSCEYWRIIPIVTLMPKYAVIVDLGSLGVSSNPDYLYDIMYSATTETKYMYVSNVKAGAILFQEDSGEVASRVNDPNLASLIFNVMAAMVDLTIENLVCWGNIACTFFTSIIGDLVNYVNEDLENVAIAFHVRVEADGSVDSAWLEIVKVTLRHRDAYNVIGWVPPMVEYRLYVDVSGGGAPCIKYCPYGGGS